MVKRLSMIALSMLFVINFSADINAAVPSTVSSSHVAASMPAQLQSEPIVPEQTVKELAQEVVTLGQVRKKHGELYRLERQVVVSALSCDDDKKHASIRADYRRQKEEYEAQELAWQAKEAQDRQKRAQERERIQVQARAAEEQRQRQILEEKKKQQQPELDKYGRFYMFLKEVDQYISSDVIKGAGTLSAVALALVYFCRDIGYVVGGAAWGLVCIPLFPLCIAMFHQPINDGRFRKFIDAFPYNALFEARPERSLAIAAYCAIPALAVGLVKGSARILKWGIKKWYDRR